MSNLSWMLDTVLGHSLGWKMVSSSRLELIQGQTVHPSLSTVCDKKATVYVGIKPQSLCMTQKNKARRRSSSVRPSNMVGSPPMMGQHPASEPELRLL